ncbi:MAG: hypothetical protein IKX76_06385, partial [Eubacterium sp.]|nr:hypothetical protein [Eubacterium sp.]
TGTVSRQSDIHTLKDPDPGRGKGTGQEADPALIEIGRLAGENHTDFCLMERGDSLSIGRVSFTCLHPREGQVCPDRNDKSLVLLLEYGDFRALFPGDLSTDQEDKILESLDEKITLLKVAHHGSRYSTGEKLLSRLQPAYAIISVGAGNLYGHPHRELLNRLQSLGTQVYQTRKKGAICLDTDGESLSICYWSEKE